MVRELDRRRSRRLLASIPIIVGGQSPTGTFSEETTTLVVNIQGALIRLAVKVVYGQLLDVTNQTSSEKRTCRVVYEGPTLDGKTDLGVTFSKPEPTFWNVQF
jgi:hypothetical protein